MLVLDMDRNTSWGMYRSPDEPITSLNWGNIKDTPTATLFLSLLEFHRRVGSCRRNYANGLMHKFMNNLITPLSFLHCSTSSLLFSSLVFFLHAQRQVGTNSETTQRLRHKRWSLLGRGRNKEKSQAVNFLCWWLWCVCPIAMPKSRSSVHHDM